MSQPTPPIEAVLAEVLQPSIFRRWLERDLDRILTADWFDPLALVVFLEEVGGLSVADLLRSMPSGRFPAGTWAARYSEALQRLPLPHTARTTRAALDTVMATAHTE